MSICWSYGVTCTNERLGVTLPRTLGSLLRGGFSQPRLFVDDCNDPKEYEHFGLSITCRYPRIRTYGNWTLALHELFYRNPKASHYALFQDDLLCVKNLREYLEATMPSDGYLNLYTVPENEALSKKPGWFPSNQQGKGALGLVFTRSLMLELLSNRTWLERPLNERTGYRNIDGGIVNCLSTRHAGKHQEYCHNPSLIQHIGTETTIEPVKKYAAVSRTFPGEEFDALSLLGPKSTEYEFSSSWASTRIVLNALGCLTIDANRVVRWLSRPVNPRERTRRLNQLGWLAKKTLEGGAEECKRRFEEILDN